MTPDKIREWNQHFANLLLLKNHWQIELIDTKFNENDLKELIWMTGELYQMYVRRKD